MRQTKTIAVILILAAALGAGCSSTKKQAAAAGKASGTDEQIFLTDSLEKNYDPNVIMKRAEAFFDKEEYAEALIEYQHFLDLHRIHPLAPYAQFKIGVSHLKMSKSIDRDPAPILKAQDAFEKLLKEFPGSKYHTEAVEKIHECNALLAQAYYFVGQFYYRRDSFLAAAYRFEAIMQKFPDMDVAPDALFYLALAYDKLGAQDWAQEKLTLLAQQYPGNRHEREGRALLAQLAAKFPANTALAKAEPPPLATIPHAPVALASAAPAPAPPAIPNAGVAVATKAPAGAPPTALAAAPQTDAPPSLPAGTASITAVRNPASVLPPVTICRIGSWC
jgi:outer membrane protein assembly factor BamD